MVYLLSYLMLWRYYIEIRCCVIAGLTHLQLRLKYRELQTAFGCFLEDARTTSTQLPAKTKGVSVKVTQKYLWGKCDIKGSLQYFSHGG